MAKELPYYQFEVAEYLAGDIMICSLEAQGLFSIIKCVYWQKECKLNKEQILRRYNREDLLDELVSENCLKIDKKGNISINFLDIQFNKFHERREKLSKAGRKGGKATLKPGLSKDKATLKHLEENREEESIIDNNIPSIEEFLAYALDKKPNVNKEEVKLKYESWKVNGWNVVRNDKKHPIKNWKSTLLNTLPYFKEQPKETTVGLPNMDYIKQQINLNK